MTHEDFSRGEQIEPSSDRSFGLMFATIFLIVGLWPLVRGGSIRWWALAVAGAFAFLAVVLTAALAPLNRLWSNLGARLHTIAALIIMCLLFYGIVTPTAFLIRLFGKDPLRLQRDSEAASYWIERVPPGPVT